MTKTTKTIIYDFTLLQDFSEVCRTSRETRLYNKYFPEFNKRFGDRTILPGAYQVIVTETNNEVTNMHYVPVTYTANQIREALLSDE